MTTSLGEVGSGSSMPDSILPPVVMGPLPTYTPLLHTPSSPLKRDLLLCRSCSIWCCQTRRLNVDMAGARLVVGSPLYWHLNSPPSRAPVSRAPSPLASPPFESPVCAYLLFMLRPCNCVSLASRCQCRGRSPPHLRNYCLDVKISTHCLNICVLIPLHLLFVSDVLRQACAPGTGCWKLKVF